MQGQFAIQVTDFINPLNDNCLQVTTLEIDHPVVTTGTTVNATFETRENDVIYFVVGNGE